MTPKQRAFEAVQIIMPASWVSARDGETMSPKAVKVAEYFAKVIQKAVAEALAKRTEEAAHIAASHKHGYDCGLCSETSSCDPTCGHDIANDIRRLETH